MVKFKLKRVMVFVAFVAGLSSCSGVLMKNESSLTYADTVQNSERSKSIVEEINQYLQTIVSNFNNNFQNDQNVRETRMIAGRLSNGIRSLYTSNTYAMSDSAEDGKKIDLEYVKSALDFVESVRSQLRNLGIKGSESDEVALFNSKGIECSMSGQDEVSLNVRAFSQNLRNIVGESIVSDFKKDYDLVVEKSQNSSSPSQSSSYSQPSSPSQSSSYSQPSSPSQSSSYSQPSSPSQSSSYSQLSSPSQPSSPSQKQLGNGKDNVVFLEETVYENAPGVVPGMLPLVGGKNKSTFGLSNENSLSKAQEMLAKFREQDDEQVDSEKQEKIVEENAKVTARDFVKINNFNKVSDNLSMRIANAFEILGTRIKRVSRLSMTREYSKLINKLRNAVEFEDAVKYVDKLINLLEVFVGMLTNQKSRKQSWDNLASFLKNEVILGFFKSSGDKKSKYDLIKDSLLDKLKEGGCLATEVSKYNIIIRKFGEDLNSVVNRVNKQNVDLYVAKKNKRKKSKSKNKSKEKNKSVGPKTKKNVRSKSV